MQEHKFDICDLVSASFNNIRRGELTAAGHEAGYVIIVEAIDTL
jgi:hypothetical protein